MPLSELPSIQRALVALEAFDAAILAWSWNLSCGLNHSLRYLMHLDGVTSFNSPGMFDGIHMEGLLSQFLVFVKCINSFLTWSVFSPLRDSQLCVSSNAILVI